MMVLISVHPAELPDAAVGGNIDVTSATDFRHTLVPGLTTKPNWLDLCDLEYDHSSGCCGRQDK